MAGGVCEVVADADCTDGSAPTDGIAFDTRLTSRAAKVTVMA